MSETTARDPEVLIHYADAPAGLHVSAHGTTFALTAEIHVRQGAMGCKVDGECFTDDNPRCSREGDARSAHAVVVREGVAVSEPTDAMAPFVRKVGDSWLFQIRGDLAWFAVPLSTAPDDVALRATCECGRWIERTPGQPWRHEKNGLRTCDDLGERVAAP